MKKLMSIIAAAVLCAACLAGCGDSSSSASSSSSKAESSSSVSAASSESTADSSSQETSSTADSSSESAVESSSAQDSKNTASLTIDVSDILANYDTLEKGLQSEEFVPKSGKITDAETGEFTQGQTALDLLKKIAEEKNIKLDIRTTEYGPYVSAINQIAEGSCGKSSGWMFKVNGKTPDVGADQCKLAAGDKVEFFYVCDFNKMYAQQAA